MTLVDPVSTMQQGEDAWQVVTDLADAHNCAFYLERRWPRPVIGQAITYGDRHAWYTDATGVPVKANKIDWNFDPDQPFH